MINAFPAHRPAEVSGTACLQIERFCIAVQVTAGTVAAASAVRLLCPAGDRTAVMAAMVAM
jgi:hypothetical protein